MYENNKNDKMYDYRKYFKIYQKRNQNRKKLLKVILGLAFRKKDIYIWVVSLITPSQTQNFPFPLILKYIEIG